MEVGGKDILLSNEINAVSANMVERSLPSSGSEVSVAHLPLS